LVPRLGRLIAKQNVNLATETKRSFFYARKKGVKHATKHDAAKQVSKVSLKVVKIYTQNGATGDNARQKFGTCWKFWSKPEARDMRLEY